MADQDPTEPKVSKEKPTATTKPARAPTAEPVLSGHLVLALSLVLTMVIVPVSGLGRAFTRQAPRTAEKATWSVGQSSNVHITVVTADYDDLGCADKRTIDGLHCAYKDERQNWPDPPSNKPVDDNKVSVLQPYRTTDGNLLLAAGLWAQPEVAMRLHNEPAKGVTKGKLARFVVACDVKFLAEWKAPLVRWGARDRWGNAGDAFVTHLKSCHILKDGPR